MINFMLWEEIPNAFGTKDSIEQPNFWYSFL